MPDGAAERDELEAPVAAAEPDEPAAAVAAVVVPVEPAAAVAAVAEPAELPARHVGVVLPVEPAAAVVAVALPAELPARDVAVVLPAELPARDVEVVPGELAESVAAVALPAEPAAAVVAVVLPAELPAVVVGVVAGELAESHGVVPAELEAQAFARYRVAIGDALVASEPAEVRPVVSVVVPPPDVEIAADFWSQAFEWLERAAGPGPEGARVAGIVAGMAPERLAVLGARLDPDSDLLGPELAMHFARHVSRQPEDARREPDMVWEAAASPPATQGASDFQA